MLHQAEYNNVLTTPVLGSVDEPRDSDVVRKTVAWRAVWRAIAREPLTHFLVAGTVLLGASSLFGRASILGPPNRIFVQASKIQQIQETWTAQWGTPPSTAQLQTLIDDYVREEIFYREAVASGLDRDDTIVRRHMAQKVEFLAQGVTAASESTDAELREFFERNKAGYAFPAKVAFSHVYFSTSTRGTGAAAAAREALWRLTRRPVADPHTLGDSFMLQSEYPPKTQDEVRDLFGPGFARALFKLPATGWQGPIASSYGEHLVHIQQQVPAREARLDEVLPEVLTDFKDRRVRSAVDTYYERLRKRYHVEIERTAGHE